MDLCIQFFAGLNPISHMTDVGQQGVQSSLQMCG